MQSASCAPARRLKHWNKCENKWWVVLLWLDVIYPEADSSPYESQSRVVLLSAM